VCDGRKKGSGVMEERKSILIVDDDHEYCMALRKVLERVGYNVTITADGIQALELLSENVFDLIISDLRMPNMDGSTLMEEIKRKRIDVPVVFITGYGEVESYMDLMNMGAFEYLNKPVKGEEILRIVSRIVEAPKKT
jgi:two-component system response regulator (stage 0 sporulation protein F)